MKSVLEWYNNQEEPKEQEQVQGVSIEQEIETPPEEQQETDNVSMNEFESCVKAVGLAEYLRNQLSNYVSMTQVPDLEGFKKDEARSAIRLVLDELSKSISEL